MFHSILLLVLNLSKVWGKNEFLFRQFKVCPSRGKRLTFDVLKILKIFYRACLTIKESSLNCMALKLNSSHVLSIIKYYTGCIKKLNP